VQHEVAAYVVLGDDDVVIDKEQDISVSQPRSRVTRLCDAAVRLSDVSHTREPTDSLTSRARGPVVHDDYLEELSRVIQGAKSPKRPLQR
jgi:hypothetical protein